jgi:CheY-like chemotaxis protein
MSEILLIEDNPADIVLTREAFKECGRNHNITALKDGEEALKYLRNDDEAINYIHPDIILLDLNLPKRDGREILSKIRSDYKFKDIPVIILSTSQNEEDVFTAYRLKANCYISKPIDLSHFFNIIESIDRFWLKTVT